MRTRDRSGFQEGKKTRLKKAMIPWSLSLESRKQLYLSR